MPCTSATPIQAFDGVIACERASALPDSRRVQAVAPELLGFGQHLRPSGPIAQALGQDVGHVERQCLQRQTFGARALILEHRAEDE